MGRTSPSSLLCRHTKHDGSIGGKLAVVLVLKHQVQIARVGVTTAWLSCKQQEAIKTTGYGVRNHAEYVWYSGYERVHNNLVFVFGY